MLEFRSRKIGQIEQCAAGREDFSRLHSLPPRACAACRHWRGAHRHTGQHDLQQELLQQRSHQQHGPHAVRSRGGAQGHRGGARYVRLLSFRRPMSGAADVLTFRRQVGWANSLAPFDAHVSDIPTWAKFRRAIFKF